MIHHSMLDAVQDLEATGQLLRITKEVDPHLELAEIQRRLYAKKAPAVLFEHVAGTKFPVLVNLYGTMERTRYLFRHTLDSVQAIIRAKGDPMSLLRKPKAWLDLPFIGLHALPRKVSHGPVQFAKTTLSALPQLTSWPQDGGAFITLPQVCSLDPMQPSILKSNLGMYRVQLSGNDYLKDQECGLHYQIHRGIGAHHSAALQQGKSLKVSIFVGGPPAHTFAAVMPLPEGMPEVAFAGVLAGTPFRYAMQDGWVLSTEADFCILGEIGADLKPEGPFGDHLGYYSLKHSFPCMKVHAVYHRKNAIWPFTVVGRPPQEDTTFGNMIHEITGPAVSSVVPGVREIHAVDAAGVHPLLLAIGSERYVPYALREPLEILTQANALLGFGQVSLAKFLFIAAGEDDVGLSTHNIPRYFAHVLERIDFARDLHFYTNATMDTLDYSGVSVNHGSKLVLAAAGAKRRTLGVNEGDLGELSLPSLYRAVRIVAPGILAIQASAWASQEQAEQEIQTLCAQFALWDKRESWPLVTLVDDVAFASANMDNWLWVAFTRTNPSHDVHGVGESTRHKHWSCKAPLVMDARIKTHHAPALVEDPKVSEKVDHWFTQNGPLGAWG